MVTMKTLEENRASILSTDGCPIAKMYLGNILLVKRADCPLPKNALEVTNSRLIPACENANLNGL